MENEKIDYENKSVLSLLEEADKIPEETWEESIKHLNLKDKDGFYRCVYCFRRIRYQGSCDVCGYKEDKALGKVD